jgi:hypothetical protein
MDGNTKGAPIVNWGEEIASLGERCICWKADGKRQFNEAEDLYNVATSVMVHLWSEHSL